MNASYLPLYLKIEGEIIFYYFFTVARRVISSRIRFSASSFSIMLFTRGSGKNQTIARYVFFRRSEREEASKRCSAKV